MSNEKRMKQIKEAGQSAQSVVIQRARVMAVYLEIEGTAPLIQNKFTQKSLEQILRKHMGISVEREKKKPREVIEQATVRNMDGRVCLPSTAIKKGMLTALGMLKSGLKKTHARTSVFVVGNTIPIVSGDMVPRMDIVRTSGMARTPDIRFRPSFPDWKARLGIEFGENLAIQSVVDLLDRAGKVGVGEWRPEKDGTFGTYRVVRHITDRKEIAEVDRECLPTLVPLVIPLWALDAEIDPKLLKRIAASQDGDEDEDEEAVDDSARASGE